MTVQSTIAKLLDINPDRITRCEEWAFVWFVVIKGKGGRFVSKRAVAALLPASPVARRRTNRQTTRTAALVMPEPATIATLVIPTTAPSLSGLSVDELRAMARDRGLRTRAPGGKNARRLNKTELLELLSQ